MGLDDAGGDPDGPALVQLVVVSLQGSPLRLLILIRDRCLTSRLKTVILKCVQKRTTYHFSLFVSVEPYTGFLGFFIALDGSDG